MYADEPRNAETCVRLFLIMAPSTTAYNITRCSGFPCAKIHVFLMARGLLRSGRIRHNDRLHGTEPKESGHQRDGAFPATKEGRKP